MVMAKRFLYLLGDIVKVNIMFSMEQKREISHAIQDVLRRTNHPELPKGEITFSIHVEGAEDWSWADIKNNGAVPNPIINPHNEMSTL